MFNYVHTVSPDTESTGTIELTVVPPSLTEVMQVLAIITEHQDLVFLIIQYISVSLGIKVYVPWFLELAWAIIMGAK